MNPKCKVCGREILDRSTAIKTRWKNKNLYFCNEVEYKHWDFERQQEEEFYKNIIFMIDMEVTFEKDASWNSIKMEIGSLRKRYSRKQIEWYVKENIGKYSDAMEKKDFDNEFQAMRYLCACFRNNIDEFLKRYPVPDNSQPDFVEVDYYMPLVVTTHRPSHQRRAMVDIENMDEEDDDE